MTLAIAKMLVWSALTILSYAIALAAYRRGNAHPFLIPVATGAGLIMMLIKVLGESYPGYAQATGLLRSLIGPATVALALPLFAQLERLRSVWRALSATLILGCAAAIASAVALGWALGAGASLVSSLAPKSATMPIAMPVAVQVGGQAPIAALAVAITGVAGAIFSDPLLRWMRIRDPRVRGFSVGLTAHAIGLAREMQHSPVAGGFAALAMCLNAGATAAMVPIAWRIAAHWLA